MSGGHHYQEPCQRCGRKRYLGKHSPTICFDCTGIKIDEQYVEDSPPIWIKRGVIWRAATHSKVLDSEPL